MNVIQITFRQNTIYFTQYLKWNSFVLGQNLELSFHFITSNSIILKFLDTLKNGGC